MTVDPKPDNDYHVISSLTSPSEERGLYDVLRLYTPVPMLEEWARKLLDLGLSYGLVTRLSTQGIAWAYRIEAHGWDDLIDRAAKEGAIRV
jgi:hypothetical protein